MAILAAIPALLALAVSRSAGGGRLSVRLAGIVIGEDGRTFTLFCLTALGKFVTAILAAQLLGESVARERAWGTLQARLATPISRSRLLAHKAVTAILVYLVACAWFTFCALLSGVFAFGATSIDGSVIVRLVVATGYLALSSLWVGAAALAIAVNVSGSANAPTVVAIAIALLCIVFGDQRPDLDLPTGATMALLYLVLLSTVAVVSFQLRDIRD